LVIKDNVRIDKMATPLMTEEAAAKTKRLASFAIIVGIILYLSKFMREYLVDNSFAIFVLGFLPNFGLAFAIPFIYVSNRVRQRKLVKHFGISCIVTLFLMVLNEIRDQYQNGRVFDVFDIYASIAGVIVAYLFFRMTLMKSFSTSQASTNH
jgi:hypothetical protein